MLSAVSVPAPLDEPYRGSGTDRPVGVPFPPEALLRQRVELLLVTTRYDHAFGS